MRAIRCDHDGLKMAEVKSGHLVLRKKHHGETHVKIVSLEELREADAGPRWGSGDDGTAGTRSRSASMEIMEQVALGGDRYRVTIAANAKVRQPPELDLDGMSFDNYLKNPVVMWAHDAVGRSPSGGLPIGRTTRLSKTGDGQLVAEFEFLEDDAFAQRVKNAWDSGFLRAASISWLPLESAPAGDGSWRDTRSELLEWSIVSVPADPDALRESHRLALDSLLGEALPAGDGDMYLLAPDDYEDMKTALALLRLAVRGARPEGSPSPESAPQDGGEADLSEIRAAVASILDAARAMDG